MSSPSPTSTRNYTFREWDSKIHLTGSSCGSVYAYRKICVEDLFDMIQKSITNRFDCGEMLCMTPNRFVKFKRLVDALLTEKYLRANIDVQDTNKGIDLNIRLDKPEIVEFSQSLHCNLTLDKKDMQVICTRKKEFCRHLGLCSSSKIEKTEHYFTAPTAIDYLTIGASLASSIFFAYKAYQETRKILEMGGKKDLNSTIANELTPGTSKKKPFASTPSSWLALAYLTASVGSGIFSAYAFQEL